MRDSTFLSISLVVGAVLLIALLFGAIALLPALVFMWGWNTFAVPMFGMHQVTFLQAVGAALLLGFLKSLFSVTIRRTT